MIAIRPIQQHESTDARRMILTVAYGIFGWNGTLEESIRHFEASGEFADLDDIEACYIQNGGLFLVAFDDDQLIGTGALRKLDAETAELKRMWLMPEYHHHRIGYTLFSQLRDFACQKGYKRIRLQTSPLQERAITFYRQLGFQEIPCYNTDYSEVSMELWF